VGGMRFQEFVYSATPEERNRAGEVIARFTQGSIHRHGVFNGDPHPGNYRFHSDGSVTFLDFGLVKRWSEGELASLTGVLDHILDDDAQGVVDAAVAAGFLAPDHGLDPQHVLKYVKSPYEPFLSDDFTYTRDWTGKALARAIDLQGRYGDVIKAMNMPPSYVILDRVIWGVSAILGRLEARNDWRSLLAEYRKDSPPSTELGRIEAAWREAAGQR
jgi:predicted unusual protein kinase regulating ubiquinone biosynthesis (AarF/ABC1/UbiB family)